MAQPTNLVDRYDLHTTSGAGTKPDIMDAVYMVDYEKTPFMRKAGVGTAKNVQPSWGQDALAAADDSNAHIDGDDFSADTRTPIGTVSNVCQISRKDIAVSGRADEVTKIGRRRETAYQITKASRELKRDMEKILLKRQAVTLGNSTTAPVTAGVGAWIKTTTSRGASGTDPTLSNASTSAIYDSGYPNAVGTAGTARALSYGTFRTVLREAHEEGATPNDVFLAPELHDSLSDYLYTSNKVAQQRQEQGRRRTGGTTVISYVSALETPWGTKMLNNDDFMPQGTTGGEVYILDMEYWHILYLRRFRVLRMGKTGDSTKRILLVDYGLCCKNEKSSAVVADINTTLAVAA